MARHPYLDFQGTIAFAHRGGAGAWPENTMPAFQHAIDLGFRYLETDVHKSADGELFAFHDARLGRVTNSDARIGDLAAAEIDQLLVEGVARIPRLEEILMTWPYARVNIDPKSDAAVLPLIDQLARLEVLDRVCIGSFSDRRIQLCRDRLGPDLCTSMGKFEAAHLRAASLGLRSPDGLEALCAQVPPAIAGQPLVDERLVETTRRCEIDVHVWTIDEPAEMHRLLDLGVDGIMTDCPAVLRSVLLERNKWEALT